MNIKLLRLSTGLFFCVFLFNGLSAQSIYQLGMLPSVNLNQSLKKDWALNFKIESRQLFQIGVFNGQSEKGYKYLLTDYSVIASKKVGLNSRITGGYLIRFVDRFVVHRIIQQYTIVQNCRSFRLAYRLTNDLTFSSVSTPEYRLRIRLTAEIPLNGQSVDPKEFYIKLNNEYLNSIQNEKYDLEIRFVPLLGYGINEHNKIEAGVDYRLDSFLENVARHNFWASLNWFIEF